MHRVLAGMPRLVHVGRLDGVPDADELEQLAPAGRAGCEHDARMAHRSSHSVTGPSLTSATCIMAPNSPVATATPRARSAVTNFS